MQYTHFNFKYLALAFCVVFFSGLVGCKTTPNRAAIDAEPYFYVVAADPQMFYKQMDDTNWRTTVNLFNRLKPDFVIVCGDMLNLKNDPDKWPAADKMNGYDKLADVYHSVASTLDPSVPLYHVPGNHDVSTRPTEQTLAWYEKRFGKPWYVFEHKNSLFVVLESNLIKDPSGAPKKGAEQWAWLDQTLKESNSRTYDHKTVYMHHPLCTKSVDEKDSYYNVQKPIRETLLKRFHDHGFEAVFCGHLHRNALVKDGDLELITTASCGAAAGKDPLGFRIVKVYPDRLEHQYYGFDEIPEKVDLGK